MKRFVVKCFSTPASTEEISVDLCEFVNESPDKYLQQKIELDDRIYLPRHVTLRDKKKNPKSVNDMCEPTSLPCYLNNESCSSEGYSLTSNGSKGRGPKTDNVFAYYKYTLRCQHFGRVARGSTSSKYKQGESAAPLVNDEKCGFFAVAFF